MRERGLFGVEEVGEHMHADPRDPAGQLGPGDQRQRCVQLGERLGGLGVPADGVVVGEGDDVETGTGGVADEFGRGVGAVRSGGVGVQVDAHGAGSRLGTVRGRPRITPGADPARVPGDGSTGPEATRGREPSCRGGGQDRIRGERAPQGSRSASAPASRRSVRTSSS
ncbi:hypothetical protein GCM10012280_20640 [Wenjunlia tyrosinilytica]|uniref:Uncharacterized protein n=1 Tax=Wenjunlia tyrosinilytica TaxID=1544741 RepID=A0A918DX22_9ACTN|nr:hypothetical protein GCM10012280_20640 [Wenjunlia tyrosinilytica]